MYNPHALEGRKQNLHVPQKQEVGFGLSDSNELVSLILFSLEETLYQIKNQSYQNKNIPA